MKGVTKVTTEAPDAAQFRPAGSSQMFVSDSKPDTGEVVRGAQGLCCKSFGAAKSIASKKILVLLKGI